MSRMRDIAAPRSAGEARCCTAFLFAHISLHHRHGDYPAASVAERPFALSPATYEGEPHDRHIEHRGRKASATCRAAESTRHLKFGPCFPRLNWSDGRRALQTMKPRI